MNFYTFSLVLGATGLSVMALGGMGHHGGHHGGHNGHGLHTHSAWHGHGHHSAPLPGSGHGHTHESHNGSQGFVQGKLWVLLSPRVFAW